MADRGHLRERPGNALVRRNGRADHGALVRPPLRRFVAHASRVLRGSPQRRHVGAYLRHRNGHLCVFRRVHAAGAARAPILCAARHRGLCLALHGLKRQPPDVICVLADLVVSAVSPDS